MSSLVPPHSRNEAHPVETAVPRPHHQHTVQFYDTEDTLYDAVASFLAGGLNAGEPVIVIATAEHRDAFRFRMSALGVDTNHAIRSGQLVQLDAHEMLAVFMVDDVPDESLFRQHLGAMIAQTRKGSPGRQLRAFGEMVDILWREASLRSAIRLEEMWNALAHETPFELFCAYSMGNFYGETQAAFDSVCRQHARVIRAETDTSRTDQYVLVRDRELLAQRATALEAEIEGRKKLELALREALADRRRAEEALRRDIAKRELVEVSLRQARDEAERANRIKAEFLAVMSHELRTPLNAIMGYEQLLSDGVVCKPTDAQRPYLERIRTSAAHLLRLINDVLDVARIDSGTLAYHIETVDVGSVVDRALVILDAHLTEAGLTCEVDVADESVHADEERLEQIVINLLTNAVKFAPPHGRILIRAHADADEAGTTLISVTDDGPGIPEDKQELIFERFIQLDTGHTRQVMGAGLGLSISRDFARGMGGDVTVTSRPGAGATFTVTLRRATRPAG